MNKWVKESIILTESSDYLDNLHKVYPVDRPEFRESDSTTTQEIVQAHSRQDPFALVLALLRLEKFPYDDPYVAFLRYSKNAFKLNPATVKRIGAWLLDLRVDQILAMNVQPKKASRAFGAAFKDWLMGLDYIKVDDGAFRSRSLQDEVVIHGGTQEEWKRFANGILDCGLTKNPDLLIKKGKTFVVGEAKFLSDFGGTQNDAFDEAIGFVQKTHGNAVRVAILDGVCWLDTGNRISKETRRQEANVMSALLLPKFLDSL